MRQSFSNLPLHPQGGATAMIIVIASEKIYRLSHLHSIIPILISSIIMRLAALTIFENYMFIPILLSYPVDKIKLDSRASFLVSLLFFLTTL